MPGVLEKEKGAAEERIEFLEKEIAGRHADIAAMESGDVDVEKRAMIEEEIKKMERELDELRAGDAT